MTLEGGAARALLPTLLPLLDGTRTREELEATLGHAVAPAVDNVLALLAEHQLLVNGPTAEGHPASAAAAFAAAVVGTTTPAAAVGALESAPVAVVGSGSIARELARLLPLSGLQPRSRPSRSTRSRPRARSSSPPPSTTTSMPSRA